MKLCEKCCCARPGVWVHGWHGKQFMTLSHPRDEKMICGVLLAMTKGLRLYPKQMPAIRVTLEELVGERFECGENSAHIGSIVNPKRPYSVQGLIKQVASYCVPPCKKHEPEGSGDGDKDRARDEELKVDQKDGGGNRYGQGYKMGEREGDETRDQKGQGDRIAQRYRDREGHGNRLSRGEGGSQRDRSSRGGSQSDKFAYGYGEGKRPRRRYAAPDNASQRFGQDYGNRLSQRYGEGQENSQSHRYGTDQSDKFGQRYNQGNRSSQRYSEAYGIRPTGPRQYTGGRGQGIIESSRNVWLEKRRIP